MPGACTGHCLNIFSTRHAPEGLKGDARAKDGFVTGPVPVFPKAANGESWVAGGRAAWTSDHGEELGAKGGANMACKRSGAYGSGFQRGSGGDAS